MQKHSLQPGMKIRCVNADNSEAQLKLGEIYTVHEVQGSTITLEEQEACRHVWLAFRFEQVTGL